MLNMNPNALPSTGTKSDRPVLETGTYPAQITLMADLGTQSSEKFGEPGVMQEKRELLISFSLPTETYTHEYEGETSEREHMLSKRYPFSNHEKSGMMSLYNAIAKKGDTLADMLGTKVMVTVGHTANGKAKITGVAKMMKGLDIPDSTSEPIMVDEDQWDALPDSVPAWVQALINDRVQ